MASTGHDMASMTETASLGMLAAHLPAAVLCGLWLAQGELAAFALVRACADRAFVPLRLVLAVLVPLPCPPAFRPARPTRRRLRQHLLVHTLTTRGPPIRSRVSRARLSLAEMLADEPGALRRIEAAVA